MPRGVRLNPAHDERTRAKIKTSQIINRLNCFVEGTVEMVPHQVTAALGLLKKTLPDLSSMEMTGKDGGPIDTRDVTYSPRDRARALATLVAKAKAG